VPFGARDARILDEDVEPLQRLRPLHKKLDGREAGQVKGPHFDVVQLGRGGDGFGGGCPAFDGATGKDELGWWTRKRSQSICRIVTQPLAACPCAASLVSGSFADDDDHSHCDSLSAPDHLKQAPQRTNDGTSRKVQLLRA
jgi:hypothetical protein